jgi:drug/metabolite transporter (DMT)-like permease
MARSKALTGILLAAGGSLVFSLNDLAIKLLSDGYALHQIILIRAFVAMTFILLVIGFSREGFRQLRTSRPAAHAVRVSIVMVSNVTFFVGLSQMPLADAVAVAYVSPIAITLLSIFVLGEKVGPRRWAAVIVGMVGVLVMLRPGTGVIQPAALSGADLGRALCLAATCSCAAYGRHRKRDDAKPSMCRLGFILVSLCDGALGRRRASG